MGRGICVAYPTSGPFDAIAQHARGLVAELERRGERAGYLAGGARAIARRALRRSDRWLLVEYMPYSFGRWGVAPGLVAAALLVRLIPRGPRLALMLHEAPDDAPGGRMRLIGLWQSWQLRVLAPLAELGLASTEANAELLARTMRRRPVVHLPIPSNVPRAASDRSAVRAALGLTDEDLVVTVFGGRHRSRALGHIEAALDALARANGGATLINLGADPPALRLPAEVRVIAPGPAQPDDLSRHLAASDVYLAAFDDGASTRRTTFTAALAHGLAVVGTDGRQTDALLRTTPASCVLVPAADVDAFADAVLDLGHDPQARARLGVRAQALYERSLGWPVVGDRLLGALAQATGPPAREPRLVHVLTAAAHPSWLGARVRGVLRRRRQLRVDRGAVLRLYLPHACTERELLAAVADVDDEGYAALLDGLRMPQRVPADSSDWESRVPLLRVLDLIVAATRPQRVVETGVERGYTSATILRRLARNGTGTLHSIDLPPARWHPGTAVGAAVPPELTGSWDLRLGPSRRLLPALLAELGTIDLFVHDADHARPAQLEELHAVWPHLRAGGLLVCDDLCNDALLTFAAEAGVTPRVIVRERHGDAFGVLVKP